MLNRHMGKLFHKPGVVIQVILHYAGCIALFFGIFFAMVEEYPFAKKLLYIGISLILFKYFLGLIAKHLLGFGKQKEVSINMRRVERNVIYYNHE